MFGQSCPFLILLDLQDFSSFILDFLVHFLAELLADSLRFFLTLELAMLHFGEILFNALCFFYILEMVGCHDVYAIS